MLLIEACGCQAVYGGELEESRPSIPVEDPKSCFQTLSELQQCIISLEQEHKKYLRLVQRSTILGSR